MAIGCGVYNIYVVDHETCKEPPITVIWADSNIYCGITWVVYDQMHHNYCM